MKQNIVNYIHELFKNLIEVHNLKVKKEINEEQSYMIEFISENFGIKIEKYFREFYVSVYKIDNLENEVNLFNLMEFLMQGVDYIPKSDYFHNEKDTEECYRKQLKHISIVINDNYAMISDFFSNDDFETKISDFEKYWKTKHPYLY